MCVWAQIPVVGLGGGGGAWTGPGGDSIGFAWTNVIAVCGAMTGADLAGTVGLRYACVFPLSFSSRESDMLFGRVRVGAE